MARKSKLSILTERNGKQILHGADVFRFLDAQGVPLEILMQHSASMGCIVDIPTFVQAAIRSGNYTADKVRLLFRDAMLMSGVLDYAGSDFERKLETVLASLQPSPPRES